MHLGTEKYDINWKKYLQCGENYIQNNLDGKNYVRVLNSPKYNFGQKCLIYCELNIGQEILIEQSKINYKCS